MWILARGPPGALGQSRSVSLSSRVRLPGVAPARNCAAARAVFAATSAGVRAAEGEEAGGLRVTRALRPPAGALLLLLLLPLLPLLPLSLVEEGAKSSTCSSSSSRHPRELISCSSSSPRPALAAEEGFLPLG